MEENFGNKRPTWDEYFMLCALAIASRSSCLNIKTGAVIVKDKRIISTGYNGYPSRLKSPYEVGYCRKKVEHGVEYGEKNTGYCFAIHAEVNAILQVAGRDLQGTTMYSLFYPCAECAKTIVGAGIEKVYYLKYYHEKDTKTEAIFKEAGISCLKLDFNPECIDVIKRIYDDDREDKNLSK